MLNTNIGNPPRVQAAPGATDRYAKFTVQPLPKGYGHTLGASLRRVLLSSIEGVAITAVQVQGVQHEFSTMPGVVEDMMEIVLNLKEIGIKSVNGRLEGPVAARIDKVGEGRVTGADVQLPAGVQIISPEKPICTLSKGEARFDAVLTIEGGVGYVPSGLQERSKTIGTIPVDAIYSPVTRVNYFVEPTRSGQQTDLDKLVIEIFTNGALSPGCGSFERWRDFDSVSGSFRWPRRRCRNHAARRRCASRQPCARHQDRRSGLLQPHLQLLKRQGIETLEELSGYTEEELMNIRNFGQKSLDEVKDKLVEYNLDCAHRAVPIPRNTTSKQL
jgi:DNA-directed RNA polymerase subunit alpha